VRGADLQPGHGHVTCGGASPRARGRRRPEPILPPGVRSIPACAGPTPAVRAARHAHTEHPRVRGADGLVVTLPAKGTGASPRARGRPPGRDRRRRPRVAIDGGGLGGASPRARGRRLRRATPSGVRRSIPACAGPTPPCSGPTSSAREHPRVRGADRVLGIASPSKLGASPRARGRHGPDPGVDLGQGSIPACAGPTHGHHAVGDRPAEHPRVRGADACCPAAVLRNVGASPRARGRQRQRASEQSGTRSIPACAGPTHARPADTAASAEHPRVRGADLVGAQRTMYEMGASPRARGRRDEEGRGHRVRGSIPACAGPTR